MIYEIYTENGTKKKRALTGNGYGLPLGTIIAVYSNTVPDGFLPCNGTTYDTTTYSALYAYLGSNKLPDLRECVLVGAGQSDNEYDANDNPTGIQAHDVYTVGQFKDDQLQGHAHHTDVIRATDSNGTTYGVFCGARNPATTFTFTTKDTITDGTNGTPRIGTTTHGKQMGVNYCIKATPAYVEPDTVSDMVNTLRTQDSYSTEEVNTGKKWIDGKPIYRKVFYSATNWANNTVIGTISNIGSVVTIKDLTSTINNEVYQNYGNDGPACASTVVNTSNGNVKAIRGGSFLNSLPSTVIIEYTKTTD